MVLFNYLIGNCDAHGKNFSIIYKADGSLELSPAYDVLCTRVYDGLDPNMAMKIGQTRVLNKVKKKDFEIFASQLGINRSYVEAILTRQIKTIPAALLQIAGEAHADISTEILTCVENNCEHAAKELI